METVSVEVPACSPQVASVSPEPPPPALRSEKGTFLPGRSGNPAGRPLGSPNRANLVKQFIEEKLTDKLEKDALAILQVAINKAKTGDNSMIKLLLGDMMAPTRQIAPEGVSKNTAVQVNVTIDNYTAKSSLSPTPKRDESPIVDVTATEVV